MNRFKGLLIGNQRFSMACSMDTIAMFNGMFNGPYDLVH